MSDYTFIPANPGFKAKYGPDASWCDVIAWRLEGKGRSPLPVTLWVVYGENDEKYMLRTPTGVVEHMES